MIGNKPEEGKTSEVDPSQVSELALRLSWLERLELAQRLLASLHPQTEEPVQTGEWTEPRQSIKLPNPMPGLEVDSIRLDSVSVSFRKLREALESSLE